MLENTCSDVESVCVKSYIHREALPAVIDFYRAGPPAAHHYVQKDEYYRSEWNSVTRVIWGRNGRMIAQDMVTGLWAFNKAVVYNYVVCDFICADCFANSPHKDLFYTDCIVRHNAFSQCNRNPDADRVFVTNCLLCRVVMSTHK